MEIKPIGTIHSPFKDKFGTPRQSQIAKRTLSKIVFNKKLVPPEMLEGLTVDSYIWVMFWFHLNQQKKPLTKVHPPRLRGKTMGVLATRSPHRPNPIGLSLGKIIKIESTVLHIEGLDLVDQTPVLDIKPFLASHDQPHETSALWTEQYPFPQLQVEFNDEIFSDLSKTEKNKLQKQLSEILCEDPRPLAYLKRPRHTYWLKYDKYDVGFEIKDHILSVVKLKFL